MTKTLLQGLLLVIIIVGSWIGLSKIDWVTIFKVEEKADNTEEKLGDLYWKFISETQTEITNQLCNVAVDSIITMLCAANELDKSEIKVHIIESDEINAYAMPDAHLVINTALITASDSPEELAGVIGHEIAHIQLDHIMQKLINQVGLSVLIAATTGQSGSTQISELVKLVSSTAFDRSLEKEADLKSIDYLVNASINPTPFADFMAKLAEKEGDVSGYLDWVSTHPASQERSEYLRQYIAEKSFTPIPHVLHETTWNRLVTSLQ